MKISKPTKFTALLLGLSLCLQLDALSQTKVAAQDVKNHIDDSITVCEKVFEARFLERSQQTILNMGGNFPNHLFTVVIKGKDRGNFRYKPEEQFKDKKICITGRVGLYAGLPQITITGPSQIKVE
ncbi:hypothetical protein [Pedobacter sp. SYSU D00535]|uniref:hypothetical protein n=1 Tax=Pedobacter sp. SYSU D00535 TaxID=2810308 RepID=UPI001A9587BB|nr:hypothetical protein [Pedobacter sp. SYSU D00535]